MVTAVKCRGGMTRTLYKSLINSNFTVPEMCNNSAGNLLTDKTAMANRWKKRFQMLLNGKVNIENNRDRIRMINLWEYRRRLLGLLKNGKVAFKDSIKMKLPKKEPSDCNG